MTYTDIFSSPRTRGVFQGFGRTDIFSGLGAVASAQVTTGSLCGGAKVVQDGLNTLGYGPLAVDGVIGSGTQSAIKKFSTAVGIGSKVWPDPTFCGALKTALAAAEAAAAAQAAAAAAQAAAAQGTVPTGGDLPPVTVPPLPGAAGTAAQAVAQAAAGGSPASGGVLDSLSLPVKIGLGVGALALLGGVVYLVAAPKKAQPQAA